MMTLLQASVYFQNLYFVLFILKYLHEDITYVLKSEISFTIHSKE